MQKLLERLEGRGSSGLRTGFSRLDILTQGFQPGNLIILAARPGIGKTSLALNWLRNVAEKHHAHVAFFSLEMSKEEVFSRLLSSHSRVDLQTVARGNFDEAIQATLIASRDALSQLPVFICDRAAITVGEISAMLNQLCSRENQQLDLLIVDYLQLISSPQDSRAARQTEAVRIGEISRSLKILAKELNIPVVVLSQLNREVEHRDSGRPKLSNLRDSGAIEQDADIVMFIHRKARRGDDEDDNRNTELIISKHRNGPTGVIPLYFEGEITQYRELDLSVGEYDGY
jgi:replicative DNA helicase